MYLANIVNVDQRLIANVFVLSDAVQLVFIQNCAANVTCFAINTDVAEEEHEKEKEEKKKRGKKERNREWTMMDFSL